MNALRSALRLLAVLAIAAVALQVAFALRVASLVVLDPQSTSFQRSEAWPQGWMSYARMSPQLARAVIAAEDAGFTEHFGVDWEALERAWDRNLRAQEIAERRNRVPRLVGGSTITQQLAKNLFLSGERTIARKGQEMLITFLLEALLDKRRILEIYLNSVEWGEGLFGADAAARHYFRTGADRLGVTAAARLAVMLPAPKRFERRPDSPFLLARAATVAARMGEVQLP